MNSRLNQTNPFEIEPVAQTSSQAIRATMMWLAWLLGFVAVSAFVGYGVPAIQQSSITVCHDGACKTWHGDGHR